MTLLNVTEYLLLCQVFWWLESDIRIIPAEEKTSHGISYLKKI